MKSKIKYTCLPLSLCFVLGFLCGCSNDLSEDLFIADDDEMVFLAYVGLDDEIKTRVNSSVTDISNSYYNGINFHFYIDVLDKSGEKEPKKSDYVVASGYKGVLNPREGEIKINWLSRQGKHNIWSWTTPWINDLWKKASQEQRTPPEFYELTFEDTSITQTTGSGASAFKEGSWQNGVYLEQFVSAAAGPVSYNENGQFVPMLYQHMVSKIMLGAFAVIDNSTAKSETGLKGDITIYGLPRSLKYYPTPLKQSADGKTEPTRAYIELPEEYVYPEDEGVRFALTNYKKSYYNDAGSGIYNPFGTSYSDYRFCDVWYIPPEMDLRQLSFKIEIYEWVTDHWQLNKKYGENGAYYGDFSGIELSRTADSNYDNAEDDFYKLHASEYLILSINLSTNGNPGVAGIVANWNDTTHERSATKQPKDGIFNIKDAKDFSDVMRNGDDDTLEEYFEVYGSGEYTEDGKGIFKLYDDIGTPNTPQYNWTDQKMGNLYVADGYILDGLDHVVEMSTRTPAIGQVRNVYLRYWISGTNTSTGITSHTIYMIYIDSDGKVWLVDGFTLVKTPTDYNVNDVDKNPFTINLETGRPS